MLGLGPSATQVQFLSLRKRTKWKRYHKKSASAVNVQIVQLRIVIGGIAKIQKISGILPCLEINVTKDLHGVPKSRRYYEIINKWHASA